MNIQELTRKSTEASELLALLANPHRLRILCELHQGERSVSALEEVIGLSQSALSQHLAKLRAANIVATRREAADDLLFGRRPADVDAARRPLRNVLRADLRQRQSKEIQAMSIDRIVLAFAGTAILPASRCHSGTASTGCG